MLIEEFLLAVTLNNGDGYGINDLISVEALAAAGTFTATLDADTVVYGTGVENL